MVDKKQFKRMKKRTTFAYIFEPVDGKEEVGRVASHFREWKTELGPIHVSGKSGFLKIPNVIDIPNDIGNLVFETTEDDITIKLENVQRLSINLPDIGRVTIERLTEPVKHSLRVPKINWTQVKERDKLERARKARRQQQKRELQYMWDMLVKEFRLLIGLARA